MIDLHRHDEFSTFDGFGSPEDNAKIAKELGYTSLGIANHGNTSSLVRHYFACKEEGIKPVLGVESYFLPKFKQGQRGYHLCLFAKNLEGYTNLNRLQTEGSQHKYYNPIVILEDLRKFNRGVICTSACVASIFSQAIIKGNKKVLENSLKTFKDIFGDDFYLEIQPYKISEEGLQEKVNEVLMSYSFKYNIKCILTSDSHRGRKEDLDSYLIMHDVAEHNLHDIEGTYKERYMPTEKELMQRFYRMHKNSKVLKKHKINPKLFAKQLIKNLEEIEGKVEEGILDELTEDLPVFDPTQDSKELIKKDVITGLKKRGKYNKQYIKRCKEELEVILHHHFEDYFLMVADYVKFAKDNGIAVGPGRGSGCNSLVNYALGITEVDSILFDLDFRRFLRLDKKKLPDIDLDFETSRRQEVKEYLITRWEGHAANISNYGTFKVKNLINDLAKVCFVPKNEIAQIKKLITDHIKDENIDMEGLLEHQDSKTYNAMYDNIIKHFSKLYKKVRYFGTHAAGVAIVAGDLNKYTSLRTDKDGKLVTNFDLADLEKINVVKFDILGLTTMESLRESRNLVGIKEFDESWLTDRKLLQAFQDGKTDGVFQFSKGAAKELLSNIGVDSFNDIVAASALNRPGPLGLKLHHLYAENKLNGTADKNSIYYKYVEDTYGTIVYQEQIQAICANIGKMDPVDGDAIIKMTRGGSEKYMQLFNKNYESFCEKFRKGAVESGMDEDEAVELFDNFFNYSFNKGHSVGYSLITIEEMFYKVYYPSIYWYTKIRFAGKEADYFKYLSLAVKDGTAIFLPHVNYTARTTIRKVEGEYVIQLGLDTIKGIGTKAAEFIENERKEHGIYRSYDEFERRCKNRAVTKTVRSSLVNEGALEFKKKRYESRVIKYNSTLWAK